MIEATSPLSIPDPALVSHKKESKDSSHNNQSSLCSSKPSPSTAASVKRYIPIFKPINPDPVPQFADAPETQSDSQSTVSSYFRLPSLADKESLLNPTFAFSCFDIGFRKQPPSDNKRDSFMGAFSHVQEESRNPFDINLNIPSLDQYTPFSNLFGRSLVGSSNTGSSSFTSSQLLNPPAKNQNDLQNVFPKDLAVSFLMPQPEPVVAEAAPPSTSMLLSELQQSMIQSQERKRILSESIYMDYKRLMDYEPQIQFMPVWEDAPACRTNKNNHISTPNLSIYRMVDEQKTALIQKGYRSGIEKNSIQISNYEIVLCLLKALQGIETRLFSVDYEDLRWKVEPVWIQTPNFFSNSLVKYMYGILDSAGERLRLEAGLDYMRTNMLKDRLIYIEVCAVCDTAMQCLDAVVIDLMEKEEEVTILELDLSLRGICNEIRLLRRFLMKETNRPFYELDRTWFYSERELFQTALERLKLNDFSEEVEKILVQKLTFGSFKSILSSLNVILHHSTREWEQQCFKDQYFKLFFDKHKLSVQKMTERLNVIHNEDHEVYSICRQKKHIRLVRSYSELRKYESEWTALFNLKNTQLAHFAEEQRQIRLRKRNQIYERKARELEEMKVKLLKRLEQQAALKTRIDHRQRQYIQELRDEIHRRQEEQKLNKLIEIERDKGFLLDAQLQEKQRLLNLKYDILAKNPDVIPSVPVSVGTTQNWASESAVKKKNSNPLNPPIEEQQPNKKGPQLKRMTSVRLPGQRTNEESSINNSREELMSSSDLNVQQVIVQIVEEQKRQEKMEQELFHEQQPEEQALAPVEVEKNEGSTVETEVPIRTVLEVCLYSVMRKQFEIVNKAIKVLIYSKHRMMDVFEFLRKVMLSGDGKYVCDLMTMALDDHSNFNLSYLQECFFLDPQVTGDQVARLTPAFVRSTDRSPALSGIINIIDKSLDCAVDFEFKTLPDILRPYFTYGHLTKYMQIFSFVIRLRHCERLVQIHWKNLSECHKRFSQAEGFGFQRRLVNLLLQTRHRIHSFLITFQNYFYFYVVEKEYKDIKQFMQNGDFEKLGDKHLKFLDRIMFRGFILNPNHQISNKLKFLFTCVRDFANIVTLLCHDDIAFFMRREIEIKLAQINEKFKEFSGILENVMRDRDSTINNNNI